jgi:hypothetical protein
MRHGYREVKQMSVGGTDTVMPGKLRQSATTKTTVPLWSAWPVRSAVGARRKAKESKQSRLKQCKRIPGKTNSRQSGIGLRAPFRDLKSSTTQPTGAISERGYISGQAECCEGWRGRRGESPEVPGAWTKSCRPQHNLNVPCVMEGLREREWGLAVPGASPRSSRNAKTAEDANARPRS